MTGLKRTTYPQVDPCARDLAHRGISTVSGSLSIGDGLRRLRREKARVLVVDGGRAVGAASVETLRRAADLGLKEASLSDVTWWGVPVVPGRAGEVTVRRLLMAGAPLVLVRDGRAVVGCVEETPERDRRGATLLGPRIDARCGPECSSVLRNAGLLAESLGFRAFAVGGIVRDLLLDRPVLDVDLAVDGDAAVFARTLAERGGGRLTTHAPFQTASIEGFVTGRVDVARTRRETYARPGSLPEVAPASIEDDLARRDFTVNAMAISLNPGNFGLLVDPLGGWRDLTHRLIRVLHPLSFIEDPTRIFRAVRYAVRLGFGIEGATLRLLRSALSHTPYASLSGQRIASEMELGLGESKPAGVFNRLGRLGAFRLIIPGYRFASLTVGRLEEIQRLIGRSKDLMVSFNYLELVLLALTERLNQFMAAQFIERLAIRGAQAERILRLRRDGGGALMGEISSLRPSELIGRLEPLGLTQIGWFWVRATPGARKRIDWFLTEGRGITPALDGDDLKALGIPAGPRIGDYLSRLRAARADGTIKTREEEEALVRSWLAESTRSEQMKETTWRPSTSS